MKKQDWVFDESIVTQFDDHVRQSVPLYELFHKSLIELSRFFIRKDSEIIDIGTSTGFFIKSLYDTALNRGNSFIGVDIESAMIDECRYRHSDDNILFINADAIDIEYYNASVVSLILVLQFLDKAKRIKLLKKIYNEIDEDSCLLIVEKIRTTDTVMNDAYNDLYYDFKLSQGLSPEEILKKNMTLRGVMKPLTLEENIKILTDIGFRVDVNVKFNNFVSMVAIK